MYMYVQAYTCKFYRAHMYILCTYYVHTMYILHVCIYYVHTTCMYILCTCTRMYSTTTQERRKNEKKNIHNI